MNSVLIPQHIFVGDTAQFLYPLSEYEYQAFAVRGFALDIPIPLKHISQNNEMTIRTITLVKRDATYYLAITFVPWETGAIHFPPLSSLPLKRQLPAVSVSSLLTGDSQITLKPPKPPLLLPGTDFILYGAVIVIVSFIGILSLALRAVLRNFRKKTLGSAKKRLSVLRKTVKKLYKEAQRIQKSVPHMNGAVAYALIPDETKEKAQHAIETWYADIDRCLRTYLQALCMGTIIPDIQKDENYFFSATYTELTEMLSTLFTQDTEVRDSFSSFYELLEHARFAGSSSTLLCNYPAIAHTMLKQLPDNVKKTEMEYAALIKQLKNTSKDQSVKTML